MSTAGEAFADFSHRCIHESIEKNNSWNNEFGGFDLPHRLFSSEENTLTFYDSSSVRVVTDVVIAGTTRNGRWQWSWANRSGDERSGKACDPVREFGAAREWPELTTAFQDADEYTGWEYVSVASHIMGAQAAYRFSYGEADEYYAYLVIMNTHTKEIG